MTRVLTKQQRLEALQGVLGMLGQASELLGEVQRRQQIADAEPFEGRIFAEIESVMLGKAAGEEGLMIEGVAAAWTKDREDDQFAMGAFDRGIENFMKNPILAYSHARPLFDSVKGEQKLIQLGVVKELRKDPQRGLVMKAFVRKPPEDEPFLMHVYEQIKHGEMKGLSVGGNFRADRILQKIVECDLEEISIAPKPINRDTLITRVTPVSQGVVE